jgi:beta-glucosidase
MLMAAVQSGNVSEDQINSRVRNMLEIRNRLKLSSQDIPEQSEVDQETQELCREIALGGIVLLKNERSTLPLHPTETPRIALIGEFGRHPVITGGGSASCVPQYTHAPIDILKRDVSAEVNFAFGVRTRRIIPLVATEYLAADDNPAPVEVKYFNANSADPVLTEFLASPRVWMLGDYKRGLEPIGSRLEMTARLLPRTTGQHTVAVRCTGSFSLFIDGANMLSGSAARVTTEQFIFNPILLESRVLVAMTANQSYHVRLVMDGPETLTIGEPTPYAASLCFEDERSDDEGILEAVEVARASNVSIIFAGRNDQYESEGFDLDDIRMPENQTRLIKSVATVSDKTVLVLHCGNPIDVSAFIDHVDAILWAHFPGQEGAQAVIDILLGKVSPSGRLPTTWFKTLTDSPSWGHFPAKKAEDGSVQLRYAEGLEVGYRAESRQDQIRFPFGFGLSYSSILYDGLRMNLTSGKSSETLLSCSVQVENIGKCASAEVVTLFVTPPKGSMIWRAEKELKAFHKIFLLPGHSQTVEMQVDLRIACSYWDETALTWVLEAGDYGLVVGSLSATLKVLEHHTCSWNHL